MRRQAGFIKTYSQVSFPAEPSEFSYFQVPPHRNNDEFSPYKFEEQEPESHILTQTHATRPLGRPPRSPLPQQTLHKVHPASTLSDRVKADQLHQRIRQKIVNNEEQQVSGSHKLQENIGNIRSKIDKLDQVMRELQTGKEPEQQQRARSYEKIKRRFEEDSFSSSSSDEEEELVVTAIPQQRTQ